MLPEDGDLEVVATEAPDAAPPRERVGVEQQRPARRGFRMHFVPPAVRVGGGDGQRRLRQGHERWRGRRGGEPEQPLPPAPRDRGRGAAREERPIRAEPRGEVEQLVAGGGGGGGGVFPPQTRGPRGP